MLVCFFMCVFNVCVCNVCVFSMFVMLFSRCLKISFSPFRVSLNREGPGTWKDPPHQVQGLAQDFH